MAEPRVTVRVKPPRFQVNGRRIQVGFQRCLAAIKRNLAPSEPLSFEPRPGCHRGGSENPNSIPPGLDRAAAVTLPRHQVVMLRHGFAELLRMAIHERDCFFQSVTTPGGHVPDREDRITLDEMDAEIDRAQYALREFDRVYPNA